jgi:hypothetical protein
MGDSHLKDDAPQVIVCSHFHFETADLIPQIKWDVNMVRPVLVHQLVAAQQAYSDALFTIGGGHEVKHVSSQDCPMNFKLTSNRWDTGNNCCGCCTCKRQASSKHRFLPRWQ